MKLQKNALVSGDRSAGFGHSSRRWKLDHRLPLPRTLLRDPSVRAVSLFGALPLPALRWGAVDGGSSLLMALHLMALHLMTLLRRVLLAAGATPAWDTHACAAFRIRSSPCTSRVAISRRCAPVAFASTCIRAAQLSAGSTVAAADADADGSGSAS